MQGVFGTFAKALLTLPGRDKEFVTVQILPDEDNGLRKEAARMALCLQRVASPGVRLNTISSRLACTYAHARDALSLPCRWCSCMD